MSSNFEFLNPEWPTLANIGEFAEKNLYKDSNTTLIKLRLLLENIAKLIAKEEGLRESVTCVQVDRIRLLKREGLLEKEIEQIFNSIRVIGNKASHDGYSSFEDAKIYLSMAFKAAAWFKEVYGSDISFDSEKLKYIEPKDENISVEYERLKQEHERLSVEFKELREARKSSRSRADKKVISFKAAQKLSLDEKETRKLIDEQLRMVGWEADTESINYIKGTRPEIGRNMAIAEWPTSGKWADYALFVGLELVGVVEAKKYSKDVCSVLDEAKRYSERARVIDNEKLVEGAPFDTYYAPFMFSTNGRPYNDVIEEKSGVWFLDGRKNINHSRALKAWLSPRDLMELLKKDVEKGNKELTEDPFEYLESKEGLGLWEYQVEAIKAVESKIVEGQDRILLTMATGTGKTRTAIGLIYRLIKSKRFKRILFLVDRSSLGDQANDNFKDAKIKELLTFTEIYDVKCLKDKEPEDTTKVHIATVQGMVRRIMYAGENEIAPSVGQYDCIIVDEAHRGYILDKTIEEEELDFKDEDDYRSKYRMVMEYFDAVKIGLTATPALHTVSIFGNPVYEYTYRQAVIDDHLVDHEPPYIIETELNTQGIKWQVGEEVEVYNREESRLEKEKLEDELKIEVEGFNRRVITKEFNKTVVNKLVEYLDPESEFKTLVFAATDEHADMIVKMLIEAFEFVGWEVDDNAIKKITGTIKNQDEAIKRFKNEKLPNIVVTVDLLTTGIDVPEIANLVFIRRVKSRILYEQMIGRATRRCERLKKDHFKIYDAVGLYDSLKDYTDMKPVVKDPKLGFEDLLREAQGMKSEKSLQSQIEQVIAKLQRKKKVLEKNNVLDHFMIKSEGKTPEEYVQTLKDLSTNEAIAMLMKDIELMRFLDGVNYLPKKQYVSHHKDQVIAVKRGYGKHNKQPGDYLEDFRKYINDNQNKIRALALLATSPEKITRQNLKELKLLLDEQGFSETYLNSAWKDVRREDILADIISFINNAVKDEPLVAHEDRIRLAVNKIRHSRNWNPLQKRWLDIIEKQLINDSVLQKEDFNKGSLQKQGGFKKVDQIFEGRLEEILAEINRNLYKVIA